MTIYKGFEQISIKIEGDYFLIPSNSTIDKLLTPPPNEKVLTQYREHSNKTVGGAIPNMLFQPKIISSNHFYRIACLILNESFQLYLWSIMTRSWFESFSPGYVGKRQKDDTLRFITKQRKRGFEGKSPLPSTSLNPKEKYDQFWAKDFLKYNLAKKYISELTQKIMEARNQI